MRCFIAAHCPKEIQEKLFALGAGMKGFGGIKSVEKENIHMTLKFLGEITEEQAKKVSEELKFLSKDKRIGLKVKGLGAFPNLSRINVIWAGLEEGNEIAALQQKIDERLKKIGFPPEEKFHPHYTLARVKYLDKKEELKRMIEEKKNIEFGSYMLESISLMESKLKPDGPVYSTLEDYSLA